MDIVRKRILVSGRVQGVGFRWFALRAAEGLGLVGWVRNLSDGSVLCEAQGTPADVARLVEALHSGPSHALVARLQAEPIECDPNESSFQVVR